VALKYPAEGCTRLGRQRRTRAICGKCGRVVGLSCNPHAIATPAPGEIGEGLDECSANSLLAMVSIDTQFVEEHLRALVRVRRLDAADEPNGFLRVVDCDQEVVSFARQELRCPGLRGRTVEKIGAREHNVLVARTEWRNPHRTIVERRIPKAGANPCEPAGARHPQIAANVSSGAAWGRCPSRSSKPVRSCNPRLGRFDSCAAP
jgi:hypothetical protein